MIMAGIRRGTETIPSRYAVKRELALPPVLFESFKRQLQACIKLRFRHIRQLRLGIVDVINIHILQTHVSQRLVELILQVRRSHAMTATHNIVPRSDPRFDESLVHVLTQLGGVSRRCAVERKITTLRADDELLAHDAMLGEYLQRAANRSLAALKAIVSGSIDHIYAKLHRSDDCIRVARVGRFIRVAEIRANADR